MPNSRSVYNFVKLEIGKAPKDAGGAPGPRQQPTLTASPTHRSTPPPTPRFCSRELGSPLPDPLAWCRGGAESAESRSRMRQVAFAVDPGESRGCCRSSIREAPGQMRRPRSLVLRPFNWMIAFLSNYEGNVHSLSPFSPWPATGRCRPLSGAGSSGGCGAKKQNATLSRSSEANDDKQHSRPLRTLWEPLIRSRRRRASKSVGLHGSRVSSATRNPAWTWPRLRGARGAVRSSEWGRVRAVARLPGTFLGAARSAET